MRSDNCYGKAIASAHRAFDRLDVFSIEPKETAMPGVDPAKEINRPNQDQHRNPAEGRGPDGGPGRERGEKPTSADAEKTTTQPVRNTPPSGDWDDTALD